MSPTKQNANFQGISHWSSKKATFVLMAIALLGAIFIAMPVAESKSDPAVIGDTAEQQLMAQLLEQYQGLTYDELFKARNPSRRYVEQLSFDPTAAKHFDAIQRKFKLTEKETELFRQNGFVSVDHHQRYSFGSAYYQIYAADLPVMITSDSILNVLHQSFDSLLIESEQFVIMPTLAEMLKRCHESLAAHPSRDNMLESACDVDLYLTVARNLLDFTRLYRQPKTEELTISSRFGQDKEVQAILGNIQREQIQVVSKDAPTEIYGGERYIDYSQFKPRGHYNGDPLLSAYFKCMMWLSRADCGWFVLPTDANDGIESAPIRELRNAALLSMIIKDSGCQSDFEGITRFLSTFVGDSDNLTVSDLLSLMDHQKITSTDDISRSTTLSELATQIQRSGLASQMIRSQVLAAPQNVPHTISPPALFQMFGQPFIIDSVVLSHVVYDSIKYNDIKVERMMPMGLDVLAALGNDEALVLLRPELEKWHYSGNLMAVSEFVNALTPQFWESSVYNVWLTAIRDLDRDLGNEAHIPQAMKTRAWQHKQLQTQLASWSELRHDTVLYAKQSYTSVPGCEYPDAYVEPYPDFFRKIRSLVEEIGSAIDIAETFESGKSKRPHSQTIQKQREFVQRASEILKLLESIARKELVGEPISADDEAFLQQTIDRRGNVKLGSGTRPSYDGWFCDLCYDWRKIKEWDPTVIDLHTSPKASGESLVLEAGVGDVNFCVIAADCDDGAAAYVGPIYSYYEFHQPANQRLTDKEWQKRITKSDLPMRPAWTGTFRVEAQKRTVDGLSLSVKNQKLHLSFCQDNKSPQIKIFDASDAGVAQLVQFIIDNKLTGRLSLDLTAVKLSGSSLSDLAKLEKLTFLAIAGRGISDADLTNFQDARPDVQIRLTPRRDALSRLWKSAN